MNWRLASRLSVITLAALVVVFVAIWSLRPGGQASQETLPSPTPQGGLIGSDLGEAPAPNFTLIDQNGKPISLAQFRGKPIVLTFLYTHCPDDCPLIANKLAIVMHNLGQQSGQVAVLAVSTDPTGDTVANVIHFSQVHHMLNYWHYLMGTRAQLAPVWKDYAIYANPAPTAVAATTGPVDHTLAIYVIDQQGRERVYFDESFSPAQLTKDLQLLLKE